MWRRRLGSKEKADAKERGEGGRNVEEKRNWTWMRHQNTVLAVGLGLTLA